MTFDELKDISEKYRTDDEFLIHPEVRRLWWKAMGVDAFSHIWVRSVSGSETPSYCFKCRQRYEDATCAEVGCSIPDAMPGSLPDATERLRQRAAEKWPHIEVSSDGRVMDLLDMIDEQSTVHSDGLLERYYLDTARQRFLIFLAALGVLGNK